MEKDTKYSFRPKNLGELFDTLCDREVLVLTLIYGLFDNEKKTKREAAEILEISSTTLRAVHRKALRKLRHSSRALFLPFLPDEILQDVFETTDLIQISRL